ncbi:hypothetical protein QOT17_006594 [Balamuthia mandrillaris]
MRSSKSLFGARRCLRLARVPSLAVSKVRCFHCSMMAWDGIDQPPPAFDGDVFSGAVDEEELNFVDEDAMKLARKEESIRRAAQLMEEVQMKGLNPPPRQPRILSIDDCIHRWQQIAPNNTPAQLQLLEDLIIDLLGHSKDRFMWNYVLFAFTLRGQLSLAVALFELMTSPRCHINPLPTILNTLLGELQKQGRIEESFRAAAQLYASLQEQSYFANKRVPTKQQQHSIAKREDNEELPGDKYTLVELAKMLRLKREQQLSGVAKLDWQGAVRLAADLLEAIYTRSLAASCRTDRPSFVPVSGSKGNLRTHLPTSFVCSTILSSCAKDRPEDAFRVFAIMQVGGPTADHIGNYNNLMLATIRMANKEERRSKAWWVYQELLREKRVDEVTGWLVPLNPNELTFQWLREACLPDDVTSEEDVKDFEKAWELTRSFGFWPKPKEYVVKMRIENAAGRWDHTSRLFSEVKEHHPSRILQTQPELFVLALTAFTRQQDSEGAARVRKLATGLGLTLDDLTNDNATTT